MKAFHTISMTTVALLFAFTTSASAMRPTSKLPRAVQAAPADPGTPPRAISSTCPADVVLGGTPLVDGDQFSGDTTNSTDDFAAGCGSLTTGDGHTNGHGGGGSDAGPHGRDEIFEFTVSVPGVWGLDSCTVPACWDTTLEIREETGGGCPGDFVSCDGDGCVACYYESLVSAFLIPASTYYLIVDGWNEYAYGSFTVTASLLVPGCTTDAECDDGTFCNGAETCDVAGGQCLDGPSPCTTYEGFAAPCDEATGSCPKPDSCFTWIAGGDSGYFFPEANNCPNLASWVFDDVQNSHHTTGVLDFYTTPLLARATPTGASPVGTVFQVDQSLFTVEAGTCNPLAQIPVSQCTGSATIDPGGEPPHDLPCSGTMPLLPNNSGDFTVCEIDFFIAYRTTENGAGMGIAGEKPLLGGPAAADDFGVSVFWLEDCPPTGSYGASFFGDDVNTPADFADAVVCQTPGGSCRLSGGSCSLMSEADCTAAGGSYGFTGTINGTDGGCGGGPSFVAPIADDTTFVTVVDPFLQDDSTPGTSTIEVTRCVGKVNDDGTPVDLDGMIEAGRLGRTARLVISAWDVGSDRAEVFFNKRPLGPLRGRNQSWQANRYNIPINLVKFPKKGIGARGPTAGKNTVTIKSDVGRQKIGWMALEIEASSPVFMLHGVLVGRAWWDPPRPGVLGGATLDDALRSEHFIVNTRLDQNVPTIDEAAALIEENIQPMVKSLGVDSIHLVAHSKGGGDAIIFLLNCGKKDKNGHKVKDGVCSGGFRVLSLTTLGTPLSGSSGLDIIAARKQGVFARLVNFSETFGTEILSVLAGFIVNPEGTVVDAIERTNKVATELMNRDTVFNTIGSDADEDGNRHISRREAAPFLDMFHLFGILDLLGANRVVDIIYRNLLLVESVSYRTVFFGLWVIIEANRTATPQGNDIIVTYNSAFGPEEFRKLVDRPDRTGHRKVYDGAEGRTHFDVTDFGVGSDPDDEDVAEWIADIEQRFGDIRFRNDYRFP